MPARPLASKKNVMLAGSIAAFHGHLRRWYKANGRHDLPWRNTTSAYEIYISEIMLQQTQVETVRTRFYQPFLQAFPTLEALARASQEEVLTLWQGLGYYSRARNLHRAAMEAKGIMPDNVEGLLALPGIGRNTAHAIAAFAYRHPVAVMEANVKRILCRIFALTHPTDAELWEKAALLLDRNDPFDYNQAMMDIGATICTPRAPKCGECPANTICKGQQNPAAYPAPKLKKQTPVRHKHIVVMVNGEGQMHAAPRTTRFLHGLYHFTELETPPKHATRIGEVRQQYSHFTLEAVIYIMSSSGSMRGSIGNNHYYTLSELHTLPMSMAEKKILRLLEAHAKPDA